MHTVAHIYMTYALKKSPCLLWIQRQIGNNGHGSALQLGNYYKSLNRVSGDCGTEGKNLRGVSPQYPGWRLIWNICTFVRFRMRGKVFLTSLDVTPVQQLT